MRARFDREADAAYIYLVDEIGPGGVAQTKPVETAGGSISLDFDGEGRLLGIEVLNASQILPRELLEDADVAQ